MKRFFVFSLIVFLLASISVASTQTGSISALPHDTAPAISENPEHLSRLEALEGSISSCVTLIAIAVAINAVMLIILCAALSSSQIFTDVVSFLNSSRKTKPIPKKTEPVASTVSTSIGKKKTVVKKKSSAPKRVARKKNTDTGNQSGTAVPA